MPRIPYAEKGTEAEGATAVYARLETEFGFVPNLLNMVLINLTVQLTP